MREQFVGDAAIHLCVILYIFNMKHFKCQEKELDEIKINIMKSETIQKKAFFTGLDKLCIGGLKD